MPQVIEIVVPGVPLAQPRVKAFSRGGHAGVYTPSKRSNGRSNGVAELKAHIRMLSAQAYSGPLLAGPLRVDLEFVFPRHSQKVWKSRPMPRYRKTTKPDRDNCDKLVMDALSGVLWEDDNQVCDGRIQKWHCAGGENPHIRIVVTELEETPASEPQKQLNLT